MSRSRPLQLEFSHKHEHAAQVLHKRRDGLVRRLSDWRDEQLARRALRQADEPNLVLDLPCGAGRFWSLLAENPNRMILAADNSEHMLANAQASQSAEVIARIKAFQTSALQIDLGANAVDCIFCIRLLHHIAEAEHRLAILREFNRVTRDTVIVSLCVDGNFKAWKCKRLEAEHTRQGEASANQSRFVVQRQLIEAEFRQAGFRIIGQQGFLPGYAMWRVYTLRKEA